MSDVGFTVDRSRIAMRLRALLYARIRRSGMSAVADDLQVSPDSLQASIDMRAPRPSVEVVLAVIRQFAVDPSWLLTGEYDLATHRATLENPSSAIPLLLRTSLRRDRAALSPVDDLELNEEIGSVKRARPRREQIIQFTTQLTSRRSRRDDLRP